MSTCNHGVTANTDDVFSTFIGCELRGLIRDRCEKILMFGCGWALVFNTEHGSYWTLGPEEASRKLYSAKEKLKATQKELSHILTLAGDAPSQAALAPKGVGRERDTDA